MVAVLTPFMLAAVSMVAKVAKKKKEFNSQNLDCVHYTLSGCKPKCSAPTPQTGGSQLISGVPRGLPNRDSYPYGWAR